MIINTAGYIYQTRYPIQPEYLETAEFLRKHTEAYGRSNFFFCFVCLGNMGERVRRSLLQGNIIKLIAK